MSFPVTIGLNNGGEKVTSTDSHGRALGVRGVTPDGRVFRWAENGAVALEAGVLVQGVAANSSLDAALDVVNATATGVTTLTIQLAAASGDLGGATANYYKDGYVTVDTSPGQAMFAIESHTARSSTAAGPVTFSFGDNDIIRDAMTSGTTKVGIRPSPYKDTIVAPTTITGPIIGVVQTAVAASEFYWVQESGWALANTDVAPAVNTGLIFGATSAGHLNARTSALNDIPEIEIGQSVDAGAGADKTNFIKLTLS
jgi:hypothetical protein